jgi:GNAT superfamily N-acetyltransferase
VFVYDADHRSAPAGPAIDVRPIETDSDWARIAAMALPDDGFDEVGLRAWLLAQRRLLVERGKGTWWGAWTGSRLVASCGSFHGDGLTRLEQLLVAPSARRQGYGSSLIVAITEIVARFSDLVVMEPAYGNWRSAMYARLGYHRVALAMTASQKVAARTTAASWSAQNRSA